MSKSCHSTPFDSKNTHAPTTPRRILKAFGCSCRNLGPLPCPLRGYTGSDSWDPLSTHVGERSGHATSLNHRLGRVGRIQQKDIQSTHLGLRIYIDSSSSSSYSFCSFKSSSILGSVSFSRCLPPPFAACFCCYPLSCRFFCTCNINSQRPVCELKASLRAKQTDANDSQHSGTC